MSEYGFGLANVVAFLAVALLFVFGTLLFGRFVRPRRPTAEKNSVYECGERPIGKAWFNFNPRFYIIALIFVAFDVEIAFTFPVASVFSAWVQSGRAMFAYAELAAFLVILIVGLAYVWRKGDLDWLKRLDHDIEELERKGGHGIPSDKH
jgi:NADH-quinone oxidoreductase subunit A